MLGIMTKLGTKGILIGGFSVVLSLFVIMTMFGVSEVQSVDEKMTLINDVNSVKQRYAINFRGSVHDRAIAIRDVVLYQNSSDIDRTINEIRQLETFYIDSAGPLNNLMANGATKKEIDILANIQAIEKYTLPIIEKIIYIKANGDAQSAKELLLVNASPAFSKWLAVVNEFIDYQETQNKQETMIVREKLGNFTGQMYKMTGISILISIMIVSFLIYGLHAMLGAEPNKLNAMLTKMAKGDLTEKIPQPKENSVLSFLIELRSQLSETIHGIHSVSSTITSQNSAQSNDYSTLSQMIKQQSKHAQLTSEQLNEMKLQAKSVTDLLIETSKHSEETLNASQEGENLVNTTGKEFSLVQTSLFEAVEQIRGLEGKSKEILSIASVINGIAEQTNLLALNAAIEAARAGESGRGFAVVADEVRSLARRSADATTQIESTLSSVQSNASSALIAMEELLPKIKNGLALSEGSIAVLLQIKERAQKSVENVTTSMHAFNDQVNVIDELSDNMNQISSLSDELTLSSNELVNKTTKKSDELSSLATKLKQQADYFTI